MMEDKINELEKLKKINKRRKIFLIVLLLILVLAVIYLGIIIREENERSNYAREWMEETSRIQEIEAFNSRFTSYAGNKKTGTIARTLISTVMTHNINLQYQGDESKIVYVKMGDITGLDTREKWKNSDATCDTEEISLMRNKISSTRRYDITASYDENGWVMGIGIIEIPIDNNNTQITNNTNNI